MTERKNSPSSAASFLSHLQELRHHLVRMALWLVICAAVCCLAMNPILSFLRKPYTEALIQMGPGGHYLGLTTLGIFDVMVVNFKVCLFLGLLIALPGILWELWRFIAPGLSGREKTMARWIVCSGVVLFYLGTLVGYFFMVPLFLQTSLLWASHYARVAITYDNYFNTLMTMLLLFACVFEVPVILSLLGLAGLLSSRFIVNRRRLIFLVCFLLGAVLAPPDVVSLCCVSLPLYGMVELSALILGRIEHRRATSIPPEAVHPAG